MSLVYDIPSLFLITSLFYILRAWKLESEHPRLLKSLEPLIAINGSNDFKSDC